MEPLKNLYNDRFFKKFTTEIQRVVPGFNSRDFLKAVHNHEWETLELKQRIRQVSIHLGGFLPGNYPRQAKIITRVAENQLKAGEAGFAWICLPDFIEVHGVEDPDTSLDAIGLITRFISCEFAIRPFLLADPEKVMKRMLEWSKSTNANVRRFSSEGCRPRLPWGKAIPAFKNDPSPILPILENLKDDPSEFVRKSVANNINDIAKDNPTVVLELVRRWKGRSKQTDWILKHGSRTLLRKADPTIYTHFGLSATHSCEIVRAKLSHRSIRLGETIGLSFTLVNQATVSQLFRIELGVYYVKSGGAISRKLFKLTENSFKPAEEYHFTRKISFTDLTTRKHYPGKHKIAIVVNGREIKLLDFTVAPLQTSPPL
jgi:3-methyladenine DNA glycosylase AlkC